VQSVTDRLFRVQAFGKMSGVVHYNQNDAVEDCRDFLRTGRCKYGASCKFNHPSNVQSGGGIKAPVDPSEPQFPFRPNEPVCQYFMKHATCKFGQACKFNHPPQSALGTIAGGTTVLSQVPQHIMMNQGSGDGETTSTMMLQLLPQRPDEPDCIYFLRNGRCKYGATCRYHHPVNYQQHKPLEHVRRQHGQLSTTHVSSDGTVLQGQIIDGRHGSVQYVTTQGSQLGGYSQHRVIQTASGAHVLVQETPVTVIHVSGNGQQSYRQVSISQGRDYNEVGVEYQTPVGAPLGGGMGLNRDRASSSSSLASSYGTPYDHGQEASGGDSTMHSNKRSSSGGNLTVYDQQRSQQINHSSSRIIGSGNDNNFAARRHRAASLGSLGSAGDHTQYHDASTGLGWSISGHPQSLPSHLETENWMENTRGSSDHLRRSKSQPYTNQGHSDTFNPDDLQLYPPDYSRQQQPRRVQSSGHVQEKHHRQQGGVDQGLSMMTDALLTMLDTPEDLSNGKMRHSTSFSTVPTVTSPTSTPRSLHVGTPHEPIPLLEEGIMPPWAGNNGYSQDQRATLVYTTSRSTYQSQLISSHNSRDAQDSFSRNARVVHENAYYPNSGSQYATYAEVEGGLDTRWSSAWQPREQNAQGISALQSRLSGPGSPHSSDVGLYL
jgi:hypothetical protein